MSKGKKKSGKAGDKPQRKRSLAWVPGVLILAMVLLFVAGEKAATKLAKENNVDEPEPTAAAEVLPETPMPEAPLNIDYWGEAYDCLESLEDSELFSHRGYIPEHESLCLVYRDSGKLFMHCGVPEDVYKAYLAAQSPDGYYNVFIKDSYPLVLSD